jgi:Flp pilus assembly pilin Flp
MVMKKIINKIKAFLAEQTGAETAEWAVIVGLLVVIGTTFFASGGTIGVAIGTVAGKITTGVAG